MNAVYAFMLFVCIFSLFGIYTLSRAQGTRLSVYSWTDYKSPGVFLVSVSLFFFINCIEFKRVPKAIRKIAGKLSDLAFGAYLGSWIMDYLFYPHFKDMVPNMDDRLYYYVPMVLFVLTGAFIISYVANLFYDIPCKLIKRYKKSKPQKSAYIAKH